MLRCQFITKHDAAFYIPLEISAVLDALWCPREAEQSRGWFLLALEFGQNPLRAPVSTVEGEGL